MNFQPNAQEKLKMPEAVTQVGENIGNAITDIKTNVTNNFNEFSNQTTAGVGASTQYLQSNTIVAKFAFLILVIVGFLFLLNLGISLISYFLSPSGSPYIIKGVASGQMAKTFPQDPAKGNVSTIVKLSNNKLTGAEFTWSVWLYINDLGKDETKYQFIFNKGDLTFGSNNITQVNNAPGLYIAPSIGEAAKIHIIMDTSDKSAQHSSIDIDKIPIRKWVNIIIRLENTIVDVYVNGVISGRLNLPLAPKQNYNDINVCHGGGFNGNLSDLRYFDHALNIIEINNIFYWGPNLSSSGDGSTTNLPTGNYISSLWYSAKM